MYKLRNQLGDALDHQLWVQIYRPVFGQLEDHFYRSVDNQLDDRLYELLARQLHDEVRPRPSNPPRQV